MSPARRIVLMPLDERPVNIDLPADVAAIAGAVLVVPPVDILPRFRQPGDTARLGEWITREAADPSTTAVVVCLDTLVHGGLIPARISVEETPDVLARLEVLRSIHRARPELPITAVSLVTRATDSYSNVEEPEYWSRYGRDLHRFGGDVHRSWVAGVPSVGVDRPVPRDFPEEIGDDFATRRLRNHQVTLAALELQWSGVLRELAITADDTAEFSVGSAEQALIEYWRTLRPSVGVDVYPGADETGAVLVCRALVGQATHPVRVSIVANAAAGMRIVPPYENVPLEQSVARQVRSSGAELVDTRADLVVVIHTPDPQRGDLFGSPGLRGDGDSVRSTVDAVRSALDSGAAVAVADLRYGNGADAALVETLADAGLLWRLCAFGGWNTAGNALGSTLALGVAYASARREGTLDPAAVQRALARRLIDDYAWQAIERGALSESLFDSQIAPVDRERADRAATTATVALRSALAALDPPPSVSLDSVTFPWRRSFEVSVALTGDPVRRP